MNQNETPVIAEKIKTKPRVGIYGLTGCAGDQLTIINCEDELLDIFSVADVRSFLMAKSDNSDDQLDIAFVEGSVSSEGDLQMLKDIRQRSKLLVALGGCACFGGPQSGKIIEKDWKERMKRVYGDAKFNIPLPIEHRPLSHYVQVDISIPGCPIDKGEFLRALARLVKGDAPLTYKYPVCVECKLNENECLLFKDIICLGPLTTAGCDSICVNKNIPCFGCRGPVIEANVAGEVEMLVRMKHPHFPKRANFAFEEVRKRAMMYGGSKMAELLEKLKEAKK